MILKNAQTQHFSKNTEDLYRLGDVSSILLSYVIQGLAAINWELQLALSTGMSGGSQKASFGDHFDWLLDSKSNMQTQHVGEN
jgi:hypothetical protein